MRPTVLNGARRRVTRLFTSRVRVEVDGAGSPYWDNDLDEMVWPPNETFYEGKASIRLAGVSGRVVEAAGDIVTVRGFLVDLPGDITAPLPGNARVHVLASPSAHGLVGMALQVKTSDPQDNQVARRLLCEAAS